VIFEFLTLLQADPAKDNGESDPCTSFPIRHARRVWINKIIHGSNPIYLHSCGKIFITNKIK